MWCGVTNFLSPSPDAVPGPHEERLIDDIFSRRRYNRLSRPVAKETDALEVVFGLSLQQIVEVVRVFSRVDPVLHISGHFAY